MNAAYTGHKTTTTIETGIYNNLCQRNWDHDQDNTLYFVVSRGSYSIVRSIWNDLERAREVLAQSDRIVIDRLASR